VANQRPKIRLAQFAECNEIQTVINQSARELAVSDYTSEQIEIALRGVWGLDIQLIRDGTYFVAEIDGAIVGCGGWSWRRTLFGSDTFGNRDDAALDPATEAGKIRAFFVHPDHVRKGIGCEILEQCERKAQNFGFRCLELGATLPGQRLYRAYGYIAGDAYEYECEPGKFMTIIPMSKDIGGVGNAL